MNKQTKQTKQNRKHIIVNFIPRGVYCNFQMNKKLHPLIKRFNFEGFELKELSLFFTLRSLLFHVNQFNPVEILSFEVLKEYLTTVLKEFYFFNKHGYVNQETLEINKIFNIFRSLYPYYKDIFNAKNKPKISWNHELEHFHNLIVLILIFELDLYIKNYQEELSLLKKSKELFVDRKKEELILLQQEKSELTKTLSGGIRVSLSRNRLIIQDRIYIGFDTEYKNIDSLNNKLLCYTTTSTSESLLKIRSNKIDFSLKEGRIHLPKTASLIETGIKLIRMLRGKKDLELEQLKDNLNSEKNLEKLTLYNQDIIYKQKSFDITKIHTSFHDVRTDTMQYSLVKLLDNLFTIHRIDSISNAKFFRGCTSHLKPVFRPECYLTAHFTAADVSLFSDFEKIKSKFAVLHKSFLGLETLSYKKWKIILRDSSLLSPAGMSLKSIGQLYPELPLKKIDLEKEIVQNMDLFFNSNEKQFIEYAIQDSKIVLWHSLQVLNSHFLFTNKYTIPVTLSSLASSFLVKKLIVEEDRDCSYHPKTQNGLISVKDLAKLNTPIGIELSGDLHEFIDYFLGSYHGGRNESYVYGIIKGVFNDYDLPGAYPTAMAMLDYPAWEKKKVLGCVTGEVLLERYGLNLIKSYTALKIKFKFPMTVKYPNLPVRLDMNSVIFPLEGETFCTGLEFVLAMKLNCKIEIFGGVYIPFKRDIVSIDPEKKISKEIFVRHPFLKTSTKQMEGLLKNVVKDSTVCKELFLKESVLKEKSESERYLMKILGEKHSTENSNSIEFSSFYNVVKELLTERIKYPKGSYMNLLYKFLANAGIGQMARGLNRKVKFDSKTNSTKTLPSGELVSPLYAGWITSYIRTTLSEIMNKDWVESIVSCTTDGFISSTPNLENYTPPSNDVFSHMYYNTRLSLTGKGELLERKHHEPKGVISWRTRGQLGLSGGIKALTGYQRNESVEETIEKVKNSLVNSKRIPFIQKSLRSAKEIYQWGGHSTLKLSERNFNLKYDNRREIVEDHGSYSTTKPFLHSLNSIQARLISSFGSGRFRIYSPISSTQCKGDAYLLLGRRMIVRLLREQDLNRVEIFKIMKEIGLPCTLNFISKQKEKKVIFNSIPSTDKTLEVLKKLVVVFPNFKPEILIRK